MYNSLSVLFLMCIFVCSTNLHAQKKQAEELGQVHWLRDYDEAIALAKKENKNVLILFQEVPGCSTCRNYGHKVLSHPLMVEAIENSFIPLAIFNNKGGKDKKILTQFNEPTWNNPVVRIINTKGENIVNRISNDYSALTLCRKMIASLKVNQAVVPDYLTLLETELAATTSPSIKQKYFKMYCFWTGEKQLGKWEGVVDTEAGFIKNTEVVKVSYDAKIIDEKELAQAVKQENITPINQNIEDYTVATKDVHYYLQHSSYKYLPLTALQQTKINSALGRNVAAEQYLSPKQRTYFKIIQTTKTAYPILTNLPFEEAWERMEKT